MKKVTHIRFEVVCLKPDILIDKPFPSVGEVFGNLENREAGRFALQMRAVCSMKRSVVFHTWRFPFRSISCSLVEHYASALEAFLNRTMSSHMDRFLPSVMQLSP